MERRATGFCGCLQEAFEDGIQDVKRSVLCLFISEGFFPLSDFFLWVRGNVVSYILFLLTSSWTSKDDFIWRT